jgi:hypothetical protein
VTAFLAGFGPVLTPEQVGRSVVDLVVDPGHDQDAYLITAAGLGQLGR